jgi:hypothetical protein
MRKAKLRRFEIVVAASEYALQSVGVWIHRVSLRAEYAKPEGLSEISSLAYVVSGWIASNLWPTLCLPKVCRG